MLMDASHGVEAAQVVLVTAISPSSGIDSMLTLMDGMMSFKLRRDASQSWRVDRGHCACYQPDSAHE